MMLNENFIAPSINIESLCDEAKGLNIVTETKEKNIDNNKSFLILFFLTFYEIMNY